jgi:hypothetical protein
VASLEENCPFGDNHLPCETSVMSGQPSALPTDPFTGLQRREDELPSLEKTQAKQLTKLEAFPTTAANTLAMAMADVDISEPTPAPVRDPSLPPAATLNSLDGDALRIICEKLDGRGLVALAKDTAHEKQVRDASRDEVHRRECSIATTLAKAEAAGDAAWAAQGTILARRLVGRDKPENLTRLISVDELMRLNDLIGVRARSRDKGAVPLSELIDGSLRSSGVGIIGADHRPPPASHVAELIDQCISCAEMRLPFLNNALERGGFTNKREEAADLLLKLSTVKVRKMDVPAAEKALTAAVAANVQPDRVQKARVLIARGKEMAEFDAARKKKLAAQGIVVNALSSAAVPSAPSLQVSAPAVNGEASEPAEGFEAPAESLCELVGLVYWRLVWIHPFADGNGRTAHLAALIVAMRTVAGHGSDTPTRGRGGTQDERRLQDVWLEVLRTGAPDCASTTNMSNFTDCLKFLEFRRLEVRKQLVTALRDADAVWARKSADEREKALRGGATVPSSPWTEVGRVLLREVWLAVGSSLTSLTTQKVTKTKVYRWTNDLGGGDYSTGITDSAGEGARPTWIETAGPRAWRDLDERMLRP